jgi:hypothetical protein
VSPTSRWVHGSNNSLSLWCIPKKTNKINKGKKGKKNNVPDWNYITWLKK